MNTAHPLFEAIYLAHPSHLMLVFALICAKYLVYITPLIMVVGFFGCKRNAHCFVVAGFSIVLALLLAWAFRMSYTSPRPFVEIASVTNYLHHVANNSFPSNHTTFAFAAAFSLFWQRPTRRIGIGLLVLGVLIGWSRIALGAHWPIDIFAGVILGFLMSLVAQIWRAPFYRLSDAMRRLLRLY